MALLFDALPLTRAAATLKLEPPRPFSVEFLTAFGAFYRERNRNGRIIGFPGGAVPPWAIAVAAMEHPGQVAFRIDKDQTRIDFLGDEVEVEWVSDLGDYPHYDQLAAVLEEFSTDFREVYGSSLNVSHLTLAYKIEQVDAETAPEVSSVIAEPFRPAEVSKLRRLTFVHEQGGVVLNVSVANTTGKRLVLEHTGARSVGAASTLRGTLDSVHDVMINTFPKILTEEAKQTWKLRTE